MTGQEPESVVLLGTGGHSKVIAGILDAQGRAVGAALDRDSEERLESMSRACIVAIGDNQRRQEVAQRVTGRWPDVVWVTAVHPTATVARGVRIGPGACLMAGTILNPGATVGTHAIINTGAIIDHDVHVGAGAHVGPGVVCAGGVVVGQQAMIGIGARIGPGLRIGDRATVGAGAVVMKNVPDGATVVGIPATPPP